MLIDFCLIFVPFGHYDEPEILRYAITSICPKGADVRHIGQYVCIGPDVVIGNGCKIQNNVSIYKGVTLEDDVFCGPSMVFTNVINPRAEIDRKDGFQRTLVKSGATIGANATVICGITINRYAFVGAGAVVTKDVPDFGLIAGNPGQLKGFACVCGERLPKQNWSETRCAACGRNYVRRDHSVELASEGRTDR